MLTVESSDSNPPTDASQIILSTQTLENIRRELQRIEECCDYSSKGHFSASKGWGRWHNALGIGATISSVITSFCVSTECMKCSLFAAFMAMLAATMTAIITFIKPSEQLETRRSLGNQYLTLRNECRRFREIEMAILNNNHERLLELFNGLAKRSEDLNNSAPTIPVKHYELAKRGIETGQTTHQVDIQEKSNVSK